MFYRYFDYVLYVKMYVLVNFFNKGFQFEVYERQFVE